MQASIAAVSPESQPYHHGNLRQALVQAGLEMIGEGGPETMTTRGVARRAGVTHATVTYHFGDRTGLLTAIAAEGYAMLANVLEEAHELNVGFLEVGVAYVHFAVSNRAHFEVMYRPELYRSSDPAYLEAKSRAARILYGAENPDLERLADGVAVWSFVHGLATLWLNGNLPEQLGDDPEAITRIASAHLTSSRSHSRDATRQPHV